MSGEAIRIDRWLWRARFFKSRGLAAQAVRAGRVRLEGRRIKTATMVKSGDRLRIARGLAELEVEVVRIPSRRGPAAEAAACYVEAEESIAKREQLARDRATARTLGAPPTAGRPDKRTRRLIRSRIREA